MNLNHTDLQEWNTPHATHVDAHFSENSDK